MLRDLLRAEAPSLPVDDRDVTRHPGLVRELDVRTAPTLLLVDHSGRVVARHDVLMASLRSL